MQFHSLIVCLLTVLVDLKCRSRVADGFVFGVSLGRAKRIYRNLSNNIFSGVPASVLFQQQQEAPLPVALPPFSIEITKGDERLCFNLELVHSVDEEGQCKWVKLVSFVFCSWFFLRYLCAFMLKGYSHAYVSTVFRSMSFRCWFWCRVISARKNFF